MGAAARRKLEDEEPGFCEHYAIWIEGCDLGRLVESRATPRTETPTRKRGRRGAGRPGAGEMWSVRRCQGS